MFGLQQMLLFSTAIGVISCGNLNYRGSSSFLAGIANSFKKMNVHTVGAATCWDKSINNELLARLSSKDISISFDEHNVTVIHQAHKTWYISGMLVDLACDHASSILKQASRERLFNLQNVWFLFNRYGSRSNTTSASEVAWDVFKTHLGESYVLPDSKVYLLVNVDADFWEVWDGFRFSVSEKIRVSRVGTVTPNRVEIKQSNRANFQRVVIRASTVILEPKDFLGWDNLPRTLNLDVFAHMHYAVSVILAKQLNFTLNLTFAPDYGWNYGNGTYSGMTGQLQREEIDFTAAGSLMRTDRMNVGDITVGTFVARTIAIYRQPPLSSVNNIFTLPFALNVWIAMVVIMIAFAVALMFLVWTSNRLRRENTPFSTALDTVTLVLGAICQQGQSINTRSIAERVTIFVLFLTAVFLFTSYAASIVVLLQSTSKTIKDISDLARQPITFSVQDTKHIYIYFNETVDENIKNIYSEKIKPQKEKAFTSPEIGVERVRNEFHSFLGEITLAYQIIANTWKENEKCSLSELELFKIPLLTLYMVKKSGYKDLFKQKIIQQHETGLKYRITKNTLPQKQKCDSANSAVIHFDSVSMKEIYPALLFLGYGISVSLLIFLVEHICTFLANMQKRNANENDWQRV